MILELFKVADNNNYQSYKKKTEVECDLHVYLLEFIVLCLLFVTLTF